MCIPSVLHRRKARNLPKRRAVSLVSIGPSLLIQISIIEQLPKQLVKDLWVTFAL